MEAIGLLMIIIGFAILVIPFFNFMGGDYDNWCFGGSIALMIIGVILAAVSYSQTVDEFKENCINQNGSIATESEYNVALKGYETIYYCIQDNEVIDKLGD